LDSIGFESTDALAAVQAVCSIFEIGRHCLPISEADAFQADVFRSSEADAFQPFSSFVFSQNDTSKKNEKIVCRHETIIAFPDSISTAPHYSSVVFPHVLHLVPVPTPNIVP